MIFPPEEPKKAGVSVKQALALLSRHLRAWVVPIRARQCYTDDPYERVFRARGIVLFAVAFRTTKRTGELSRTFIPSLLRLPNECGLLRNFQRGKTLHSEANRLLTGPYY